MPKDFQLNLNFKAIETTPTPTPTPAPEPEPLLTFNELKYFEVENEKEGDNQCDVSFKGLDPKQPFNFAELNFEIFRIAQRLSKKSEEYLEKERLTAEMVMALREGSPNYINLVNELDAIEKDPKKIKPDVDEVECMCYNLLFQALTWALEHEHQDAVDQLLAEIGKYNHELYYYLEELSETNPILDAINAATEKNNTSALEKITEMRGSKIEDSLTQVGAFINAYLPLGKKMMPRKTDAISFIYYPPAELASYSVEIKDGKITIKKVPDKEKSNQPPKNLSELTGKNAVRDYIVSQIGIRPEQIEELKTNDDPISNRVVDPETSKPKELPWKLGLSEVKKESSKKESSENDSELEPKKKSDLSSVIAAEKPGRLNRDKPADPANQKTPPAAQQPDKPKPSTSPKLSVMEKIRVVLKRMGAVLSKGQSNSGRHNS